jgi:peroxiredoxin (alkyl hydroperoxide reductase subunit C)
MEEEIVFSDTIGLGEPFPEIEVKTTQGVITLPEYFKGKWFVLFSHPADFTPVCTTEFVAFQQRYEQFKSMGVELIGLSVDQVFSHIKWLEWIEEKMNVKITFPVIADETGEVSELLGLLHPAKGTNTVRGVFIVDDKGVVRSILYYPQELGRNVDEILRMVKALKVSDEHNVALPHNWPNNELIGDKVIIPPAETEQQAQENKNKYEHYDWWFCYKKIE